ncbi:MAG: hypothetical protein IKJ68_08610 [Clostridia bacterium]|nr:hypothetical protein [Clostridia bacterium]
MWILRILLFNLTIVFVVELTLALMFGATGAKKILTVALINIITNPTVVMSMLTISVFCNKFETVALIVLEILVFLAEGLMFAIYKPFKKNKPYLISFVLNLSSFMAGNIIKIFL